jgi:hypothetical protein
MLGPTWLASGEHSVSRGRRLDRRRRCRRGGRGGRWRCGWWSRCRGRNGAWIGLALIARGRFGQIALLIALFLEIGLVPAASGQAKRGRGKPAMQLRRLAGRANYGVVVRQFLQSVKAMTTTAAFEFIDWHEGSGGFNRPLAGSWPLSTAGERFQCRAETVAMPTGTVVA